jgi:hypothetical protein
MPATGPNLGMKSMRSPRLLDYTQLPSLLRRRDFPPGASFELTSF